MDNVIAITTRDVYGAVKAYPANDQALKLAAIAGTATLTPGALSIARDMGFVIRHITVDQNGFSISDTPSANDALAEILGEYGVSA